MLNTGGSSHYGIAPRSPLPISTQSSGPLSDVSALINSLAQVCVTELLNRLDHALLTMFKITNNTVRYFSLAEVLLMAAMNQVEASVRAQDLMRVAYRVWEQRPGWGQSYYQGATQ